MNMKRMFVVLVLLSIMVLGTVAIASAKIPVNRFIEPDGGDKVSGTVQVLVFSPDELLAMNSALPKKEVRLIVGNLPRLEMTYLGNWLYTTAWDTTQVANGKFSLTALIITWSDPPRTETVTIEVIVENKDGGPVATAGDAEIAAAFEPAKASAGLPYQTDPVEPGSSAGPAPIMLPFPIFSDPGAVPTPVPPPMPPFPPDPSQVSPPSFP